VAASAAMPLTTMAAPVNMQTEQDNPTIAQTSVTQATAGQVSFKARTVNPDAAGVVGSTGDETDIDDDTQFTGVYGFSQADAVGGIGAGVWGSSGDTGVVGSGYWGVYGVGVIGVWGDGAGGPGIIGDSASASVPGVLARGATSSGYGLQVVGKVKFNRSGRATILAGKSSIKVTLAAATSSTRVFAVLHSNRSGRYVRAVVPTTGSFTIYLNSTVTSSTYVAWFALD